MLTIGTGASGNYEPPPPALWQAIRNTEDKYGIFPIERIDYGSFRYSDCEVKRAGAIWTEKLDTAQIIKEDQ